MSVQTVDHFFNPASKEFIHDPVPTLEKLSAEHPISRFDAWQAWLVTGHANIIKCLLDTRLSTDFNLWEYAPPKKPVDEMDAFEIFRAIPGTIALQSFHHVERIGEIVSQSSGSTGRTIV